MLNALRPICSWATGGHPHDALDHAASGSTCADHGCRKLDHNGQWCLPLISLCFLVSFIAADAWMSRQPISLRSICSSVLELYESRGEITYNEKWQQELSRLRDACAVALYKYEPTSTKYGLTSTR